MAKHDRDGDIDYDFGSSSRHDPTASGYSGTSIQDKLIDGADSVTVQPPQEIMARKYVEPPPPLPANAATMECLRGPCIHLWSMTARFEAQSDKVRIARVRQCNCHAEATELTEQTVFQCDQWWPRWLAFVPESLRTLVRRRLRKAWERALERRGYNFDWRDWPDDVFESDRPEQRGRTALGVGPATFWQRDKGNGKPGPTVEATEDGLYFNK